MESSWKTVPEAITVSLGGACDTLTTLAVKYECCQRLTVNCRRVLEWGGTKKDIACLIPSGLSLVISIFDLIPLPFDAAWVAIILAIRGDLGPVVGALVHNAGSVLVIINSALLLSWKKKN